MGMPTVLYVDDEFINLTLFKANFKKYYNIITVSSGQKALEELDNNKNISVVVSDNRMPNMSGIEFICEAKKCYPQLSCYLLSGFDISDEVQQILNDGTLAGYFKKPLNQIEIKTELDAVLVEKEQ